MRCGVCPLGARHGHLARAPEGADGRQKEGRRHPAMRGAAPTRRAEIDPDGPGVYPGGHARGVRLGRSPRGPMGEAARGSEQPRGARMQQMGLHEPYPSQSLQPPQGVYKGLRQFARDRSKWDFASTHAVPIATAFVCWAPCPVPGHPAPTHLWVAGPARRTRRGPCPDSTSPGRRTGAARPRPPAPAGRLG